MSLPKRADKLTTKERNRRERRAGQVGQTSRVAQRVLSSEERSQITREAMARRRERQLAACEIVPVAPFRERYLELHRRRDMSLHDVARIMEWSKHKRDDPRWGTTNSWDDGYAARVLGLRAEIPGKKDRGVMRHRETISYEVGVKLCDALGMDYHEGGV